MREAIGGISIFQIFIVFILLFTGYVCLSINYSKAYSVKNELLTIIKNQGGVCTTEDSNSVLCENFQHLINNYLQQSGYRSTGKCDNDWEGFKRDGTHVARGENAAFCVRGINIADSEGQLPTAVYYEVKVFYQIDIPIFRQVFNFSVKGETSRVYSPSECVSGSLNYCWCSKTCEWNS